MNRRIEEYGGKMFTQLSEGVGRQVGTVLTCRNRQDPGRRERFGKSRSDPFASLNSVNNPDLPLASRDNVCHYK